MFSPNWSIFGQIETEKDYFTLEVLRLEKTIRYISFYSCLYLSMTVCLSVYVQQRLTLPGKHGLGLWEDSLEPCFLKVHSFENMKEYDTPAHLTIISPY